MSTLKAVSTQEGGSFRGVDMYENPTRRLSDDQIEHAVDAALSRDDAQFLHELVEEIARRGREIIV